MYTWIVTELVILEGLILRIFGGRCALTIITWRYSDLDQDNLDVFLPNWLAGYNHLILTTVCIVGLLLVGCRLLQRA